MGARSTRITDTVGTHRFPAPPRRIIALTWEAAEQVLELGIAPLAVADADDYREWVVRPNLPASTLSAGTRLEPNLELLIELKPDLILISPVLADMQVQLARIAPVLQFDAYRHDHDNAAVARQIFIELGRLLDRESQARQRLQHIEQRFTQLRTRLTEHFGTPLPEVEVVRFASPAIVFVYGANAMPIHALRRLGFTATEQQASSRWGVSQKHTIELASMQESIVLYQEPFEQAEQLFDTPLWQAMPFIRQGRFAAMRPTWSYGGAASLQYLAEAITEALLSLSPTAPRKCGLCCHMYAGTCQRHIINHQKVESRLDFAWSSRVAIART
nr:iron-siderophore ABC transporter substrate-binding protein [Pseudomonas sp.]